MQYSTFVTIERVKSMVIFTKIVNAHNSVECYKAYVDVAGQFLDSFFESLFQSVHFILTDTRVYNKK